MSGCVADHDERVEALDGILLCKAHRRRLDDNAHEIQALIVDTMRIRDGGAPLDNGPKGKTPKKRADPPAPGDTVIMSMFDPRTAAARIAGTDVNPAGDQSEPLPNVLAVVASWLMLLAEERPLTATLPKSVLAQLDLLERHHEWLAAQEYVDDYLREMNELRNGLRSAVNDRTSERVGECQLPTEDAPVCRGALLKDNGSDVVRCVRCRAQWITPQERARLAVSQEAV